eukprot:SAG22_NODE_1768_length_3615_cov_6.235495_4_plen_53_part_00
MDAVRRAARSPSPFRLPNADGAPAYLLTDLLAHAVRFAGHGLTGPAHVKFSG